MPVSFTFNVYLGKLNYYSSKWVIVFVAVMWEILSYYLRSGLVLSSNTCTLRSAGMFSTFNTVVQRENFIALWKGTSPVSLSHYVLLQLCAG